jgi:hypothetical protein
MIRSSISPIKLSQSAGEFSMPFLFGIHCIFSRLFGFIGPTKDLTNVPLYIAVTIWPFAVKTRSSSFATIPH